MARGRGRGRALKRGTGGRRTATRVNSVNSVSEEANHNRDINMEPTEAMSFRGSENREIALLCLKEEMIFSLCQVSFH